MLAWYLATRRMPAGHDGFHYLALQYFFLNNLVQSGEIPLWIPFMTHGTVSNIWYVAQGSIAQSALLTTGTLFRNANQLDLFNLSIFLDRMVLLIGTWLLARRSFSSSLTCFFVTTTALGSSVWMTQTAFSLHLFYAIPLILELIRRFLDTGRWRYVPLVGGLVATQLMGSPPYFFPITTFVVAMYFGLYAACNPAEVKRRGLALRLSPAAPLCMALAGLPLLGVWLIISPGIEQVVTYDPGRSQDLTTSLEGFLSYGGNTNLWKWLELILAVSPAYDYTAFIGFLPVPLCVAALVRINKRNAYWPLVIGVLVLVSVGSPLASLLYESWPFMKFYRHLALLAPLIKLFLCFLAGFGFEALFLAPERARPLSRRIAKVLSLALISLTVVLVFLAQSAPLIQAMTNLMINCCLPRFDLSDFHVQMRVLTSATGFLITALFLGLWAQARAPQGRSVALWCLIALHTSSMYTYYVAESLVRTVSVDDRGYALLAFQAMPFEPRREQGLRHDAPRYWLIDQLTIQNTLYWVDSAFLFQDELGSSYRTDRWMRPWDQFLRTFWDQGLDPRVDRLLGLTETQRLEFPLHQPAARRLAGGDIEKIQFFSTAYEGASDDEISQEMRKASYQGDNLWLSPATASPPKSEADGSPPTLATRLNLPYDVLRFDANNAVFSTTVPHGSTAWMLYADVWHPSWTATVNGEPTAVRRGALAYKAVALQPGPNLVHFAFRDPVVSTLSLAAGLNGLVWIVLILVLMGQALALEAGRTGFSLLVATPRGD